MTVANSGDSGGEGNGNSRSQARLEEKIAAIIARQLGDNLELAFLSKSSWTHARGIAVDGSFRDINAPLRSDYINAARAAIETAQASEVSGS